ncbi:hypothetical protein [Vibrio mangrovi]|uniref:Uncharacterized protein n=1 Tax=Vibrio mangrovi TaxID=474394 RepID=A0A1Y6IVY2_9VIBR|nr:hypothetical protein [Vibrio mangrovi]MDW6005012.1 hypothetical protein [Vibrio mangrovi]SMS01778.1 hypothetical protein VIM7927_03084 [Vibrio mangrovi]
MISAEEYELLGFFEVEPKMLDYDTPWIYNSLVYEVTDKHRVLTVSIQPSYKDVKVILTEEGDKIFEFEGTGVRDIRVLNDNIPEILEIKVSEEQSIFIKRKPHISIYLH